MGLEIAIGLAVISFIAGGLLGHFGNREARSNKLRAAMLQAELEAAQSELADYRQEVAQQFSETAEKFRTLDESYHALHRQLATSAVALLADQDVPLLGEPRPEHRGERIVGDVDSVPVGAAQDIGVGPTDLPGEMGREGLDESEIVVAEPEASANGETKIGETASGDPVDDGTSDKDELQSEDQARLQAEHQGDEVPTLTDSPEETARTEKSASA